MLEPDKRKVRLWREGNGCVGSAMVEEVRVMFGSDGSDSKD